MRLQTELPTKTRIYNQGDMANAPHFGTISKVIKDKWGLRYEITPDKDRDDGCCPASEARRKPYVIPAAGFSPEYLGHGGTRIVTAKEYYAWRKREMAKYTTKGQNNEVPQS